MADRQWLTTKQAAELLDVDSSTIRQLCITNKVDSQKFGHVWMVDRQSLEEYGNRPTRFPGRGKRKNTPQEEK